MFRERLTQERQKDHPIVLGFLAERSLWLFQDLTPARLHDA